MKEKVPLVGIINSDKDMHDMLRFFVEGAGFRTASESIENLKAKPTGYPDFIKQYDPDILVFEASVPYTDNCQYIKRWISLTESQGRGVIIVSTNPEEVVRSSIKSSPPTLEILALPCDMDMYIEAITRSFHANRDKKP